MTNLISAEGLKRMCEEYDHLWKVERPKVVRGVADAAAEGDRSENAEYIYGKKRLREIDSKLKHLTLRLKVLKVASVPMNPKQVTFGCWVTYEEETGDTRCYQRSARTKLMSVSAGSAWIHRLVRRCCTKRLMTRSRFVSRAAI